MLSLTVQVSKALRPACCVLMSTPGRIRASCCINVVNLVLGGILAGCLRGQRAVADTVSIVMLLGVTVALQARMHYLATRFTDESVSDAVVAYVQQAQANLQM